MINEIDENERKKLSTERITIQPKDNEIKDKKEINKKEDESRPKAMEIY